MMYVRFPLSLRNLEDLLHERGIDISWKAPSEVVQFFGIELSRFQEDDEMAGKREKPENIVLKLRQVEVL
jgi:transposase-like protein